MATLEQNIANHMAALQPPAPEPGQTILAGQWAATAQLPVQHGTPIIVIQTSSQEEEMESGSEAKDGELSEEDIVQQDPPEIRLFYPDQFPKNLHRVCKC